MGGLYPYWWGITKSIPYKYDELRKHCSNGHRGAQCYGITHQMLKKPKMLNNSLTSPTFRKTN